MAVLRVLLCTMTEGARQAGTVWYGISGSPHFGVHSGQLRCLQLWHVLNKTAGTQSMIQVRISHLMLHVLMCGCMQLDLQGDLSDLLPNPPHHHACLTSTSGRRCGHGSLPPKRPHHMKMLDMVLCLEGARSHWLASGKEKRDPQAVPVHPTDCSA